TARDSRGSFKHPNESSIAAIAEGEHAHTMVTTPSRMTHLKIRLDPQFSCTHHLDRPRHCVSPTTPQTHLDNQMSSTLSGGRCLDEEITISRAGKRLPEVTREPVDKVNQRSPFGKVKPRCVCGR